MSNDVAESKNCLSDYKKRQVLSYLQENGCTIDNLKRIAATGRTIEERDKIISFICDINAQAKALSQEECASLSLSSANQWLDVLKDTQLSLACEYEAAAAINAIVRNEQQPNPNELDGINMSEVYEFVEKALTGQPQGTMNTASRSFLVQEIELLFDEANSDESEDIAQEMFLRLTKLTSEDYQMRRNKHSSDPFLLDD